MLDAGYGLSYGFPNHSDQGFRLISLHPVHDGGALGTDNHGGEDVCSQSVGIPVNALIEGPGRAVRSARVDALRYSPCKEGSEATKAREARVATPAAAHPPRPLRTGR